MTLDALKRDVLAANLDLARYHLALFHLGQRLGDRSGEGSRGDQALGRLL